VTGVTDVTGPEAQEGPQGTHGAPRGLRKGPGKEAAQEGAVKAKVGAISLLEKGRK
jgi:hypothetical protein